MNKTKIMNEMAKIKHIKYWIDQGDCDILKNAKKQTPEMCFAYVSCYGSALQYVKEQTPEICLAAVKKQGCAIKFVKKQTPEICLAAVNENSYAIRFIKKQTPELWSIAIKNNPDAAGDLSVITTDAMDHVVKTYPKTGKCVKFVVKIVVTDDPGMTNKSVMNIKAVDIYDAIWKFFDKQSAVKGFFLERELDNSDVDYGHSDAEIVLAKYHSVTNILAKYNAANNGNFDLGNGDNSFSIKKNSCEMNLNTCDFNGYDDHAAVSVKITPG